MFGKPPKRAVLVAGGLILAAAAMALPALASDGGEGVEQAGFPADRELIDDALTCLDDRGFGTPTPDDGVEGPGVFIPKAEAESDAFREAADDCGLPEPPTDAEIRDLACSDMTARAERRY
jgi:hypothetical protein